MWALLRQENYEHYMQFSAFMEKRGSVDYLVHRIEHFEALYERRDRGGEDEPPADA